MRHSNLAVILLTCALGACGSMPVASGAHHFDPKTDPYWDDPRWEAALLNAVQSVVHAPDEVAGSPTPSLHGAVSFTLVNGDIEHVVLAESTGNPRMDELMLDQVATAHAPAPSGPHAGEPHDFILGLDMPTPFESFEYTVYAAIDRQKIYTKEAVLGGAQGNTTVDFDYTDGLASNVIIASSSKDKRLDIPSMATIMRAVLPPAPPAYAGKALHMEVIFCYALNDGKCPAGKNVIEVRGTRLVSTSRYMEGG